MCFLLLLSCQLEHSIADTDAMGLRGQCFQGPQYL